MAWVSITDTNWEYDDDVFSKLSTTRQEFWSNQNVSISNGIRTLDDGTEIYMRVRQVGDPEPDYLESELNKTYIDNL